MSEGDLQTSSFDRPLEQDRSDSFIESDDDFVKLFVGQVNENN